MEGQGESCWNAARILPAHSRGVTCWFILFCVVLDEPCIKQMRRKIARFLLASPTFLPLFCVLGGVENQQVLMMVRKWFSPYLLHSHTSICHWLTQSESAFLMDCQETCSFQFLLEQKPTSSVPDVFTSFNVCAYHQRDVHTYIQCSHCAARR